jgi:hypothetical protein
MYSIIIKELPDFQSALSDKKVISKLAPQKLKNAVSELFRQLKMKVQLASKQRYEDNEKVEDLFFSSLQ